MNCYLLVFLGIQLVSVNEKGERCALGHIPGGCEH